MATNMAQEILGIENGSQVDGFGSSSGLQMGLTL
jgi:hypothetical protein